MSDVALKISGLGKKYRIGAQRRGYRTLRETISDAVTLMPRRVMATLRGQAAKDRTEEFWALRGVDLQVGRGEVVGVIGRNGAGKTTLLKILSRITSPSTGEVEIHGRVGSLLEVGTGFHPELSGRENIYLNGSILGMKRSEIDAKFDQIVEFAEIAQFIETPVKHYSSGMYVRLAFSVAAHLEPEILLVDEVLAVGDAAFQRKCLGRLGTVASEGRTVLFVSHNMTAVQALCERVVVLEGGKVVFSGPVEEGLRHYLSRDVSRETRIDLAEHPNRKPGMRPVVRGLRMVSADGTETSSVRVGDTLTFEVDLDPAAGGDEDRGSEGADFGGADFGGADFGGAEVSVGLYDHFGQLVCVMKSTIQTATTWSLDRRGTIRCHLRDVRLIPGEYEVGVAFSSHRESVDWIESACAVEVVPSDIYGSGQSGRLRAGYMVPDVLWDLGPYASSGSSRAVETPGEVPVETPETVR